MIEWYSNKYVEIYFDNIPKIAIRYILPYQSKDKKKSVKKYPFLNRKSLKVSLKDKKKTLSEVFTSLAYSLGLDLVVLALLSTDVSSRIELCNLSNAVS